MVVDLVSPAENELVRLAKDASAAMVLVTAMTSVVVGSLILGPAIVSETHKSDRTGRHPIAGGRTPPEGCSPPAGVAESEQK